MLLFSYFFFKLLQLRIRFIYVTYKYAYREKFIRIYCICQRKLLETLVILIMKFAFTSKMYIKITTLYFFAFVHMHYVYYKRTLSEKLEQINSDLELFNMWVNKCIHLLTDFNMHCNLNIKSVISYSHAMFLINILQSLRKWRKNVAKM